MSGLTLPAKKPAGAKARVPALLVGDDHGRQDQGYGGAHDVEEVLAPRGAGLGVLVMGDQGIGSQGKHLVKEVQGEQVGAKGHPDGGGQGHREKAVVAGLGVLIQAAHVADGVGAGHDPQAGGDQGEQQIRMRPPSEGQRRAGQHFGQGDAPPRCPASRIGQQGGHQDQLEPGGGKGDAVSRRLGRPRARMMPGRASQGHQHRQQGDYGAAPLVMRPTTGPGGRMGVITYLH